MPLKDEYILPAAADMHVHLRNAPGPIAELVTPTIRPAGVDVVFVMPNLAPRPVVSVDEALEYKRQLQAIDSSITYLMSLYLHSSITPDEIRKAKKAGIAGVKVPPPPPLTPPSQNSHTPQAYPKGATTNSEWGVLSFDPLHDVLKAMEEEGIVLNLHGEVPSSPADGVTVMNAESKFLPTLRALVSKYPNLKIVLEHCTTADAVETVRSFGENVVGTIVRLSLPPSCHHPLTQPDRPPPVPPRRRLVRQRGTSLPPPLLCPHHLTSSPRTTTANPRPNPPRTAAPSSTPSSTATANSSSAPIPRVSPPPFLPLSPAPNKSP